MIQQTTFTLRARARGFHLVTDEVLSHLPALPKTGLLNLFIQHTSAGLSVNENCDPDVRSDMEKIFNNLVRERESWYHHNRNHKSLKISDFSFYNNSYSPFFSPT